MAAKINKNMFMFNALVGEGGFGSVLSGMFIKNSGWYAVKEINKFELLQHKTGLDMIFGELRALQRVEHPFIVGLQSAFHDNSSCFLVLDLKCGGDLRFYLRKRLLFEEKDVAFYVACIASALEHIHSMRVLHRDVKPENIILDDRGYPHLADFGVAYVEPEGTPAGTILSSTLASGTKQYLAPEVFVKGHLHGAANDYWSLGIMAYEMIYGERPFDKHAPNLHIVYLDDALKRTERLKRQALDDYKRTGEVAGGGSGAGAGDGLDGSSPASSQRGAQVAGQGGRGANNYSTANMSSATSANTSPMLTSDAMALALRKKRGLHRNARGDVLLPSLQPSPASVNPISGSRSLSSLGSSSSSTDGRKHHEHSTHALEMLELPNQMFEIEETKEEGLDRERRKSHTPPRRAVVMGDQVVADGMEQPHPSSNARDTRSHAYELGSDIPPATVIAPDGTRLSLPTIDGMVTGDHWTVHSGLVPMHCRIMVSLMTVNSISVSSSCIDIMEKFFDCRPSHRIGGFGQNLAALKQHRWFTDMGLPSNWKALEQKKHTPNFIPDKKFMQTTFWSAEAQESYREMIREEEQMDFPTVAEQEQTKFDDFNHSSRLFKSLIVPPPPGAAGTRRVVGGGGEGGGGDGDGGNESEGSTDASSSRRTRSSDHRSGGGGGGGHHRTSHGAEPGTIAHSSSARVIGSNGGKVSLPKFAYPMGS